MVLDERRQRVNPYLLTWPDVDPATHPFDPAGALDVVRQVASPVPPRPDWRNDDYRAMNRAAEDWRQTVSHGLADRYGRWAAGWCWAPGEGDYDGGPVGNWCCCGHSITEPEATLAVVAESLCEWREWLEDLAGRFDRLRPEPGEDPYPAWESAIGGLITACLDRTSSDSGWYSHCELVLRWFLSTTEVPADRHDELIEEAIGGSFRSWAEPSTLEITRVAERFAGALTGRPADPNPEPDDDATAGLRRRAGRRDDPGRGADALSAWMSVRERVAWDVITSPSGPARTSRDAIAEHVARRGDGGPELAAALTKARADAATGAPLTFALLASWQRIVLGADAPFRTGPAGAKGGRESYHWRLDLPERFEQCLAEATADCTPVASRAARVYLDVAFFHPFDDGNGRAALLALYYVLARDGVVLDRAAPMLRTRWHAHDRRGAATLARLIHNLIRQTASR